MVNTSIKTENISTERFQNAEQMWFWFLYCKSIQNGFHHNTNSSRRPCELLDIETLITKLYLSGKLSEEHLIVMKKFGDKRRAPHQYIFSENKSAAVWDEAMKILDKYARERGWLVD